MEKQPDTPPEEKKFWLLDFIRAFRKLIYITLYGFDEKK